MASNPYYKEIIKSWVFDMFPPGATCLDVGACNGIWFNLLGQYMVMDAVEIYEPYIKQYELERKYRRVLCEDIKNVSYNYYDLILFGDVIEHLDVPTAQFVLNYASSRCKAIIIAVPFKYKQGIENGNIHEIHIQDDLTPELFAERYPGFELLAVSEQKDYAYYGQWYGKLNYEHLIDSFSDREG